jgi:deoxyribodipyrimidine photo-lyase
VVAVDSYGIVPGATFLQEEYAPRTIRPKLAKLLDSALEPVEDRAPRRRPSPGLLASLELETIDPTRADLAATLARCEVDHTVGRADLMGGLTNGRARLAAFADGGLQGYHDRQRDPTDEDGTSRLSPYLRFGQLSAAEIARTAIARAGAKDASAFLDNLFTWRELAFNFCLRNPVHTTMDGLPDWVRRTMTDHADDTREAALSLDDLERGATPNALWNAAHQQLVRTGVMHHALRMLWGKSVMLWTESYAQAHAALFHLNDRYALDGHDPAGVAGIQWCFGKFDRPFVAKPVWGTIRPMSLGRAHLKFDVSVYTGGEELAVSR